MRLKIEGDGTCGFAGSLTIYTSEGLEKLISALNEERMRLGRR